IQGAPLDAGAISRMRHGTAECIDLAHEMALADSANGWIAAHLPNGFDAVGQQQGTRTTARRRQRRLGAGMAATDDDDLEILVWLGRHGSGFWIKARDSSGPRVNHRLRDRPRSMTRDTEPQLARILLYSNRTPTGTRRMRARRRPEFRGWPCAGGRMHLR